MSTSPDLWICCQLGGREHYAVPRSLQRAGARVRLVTDVWARPGGLAAAILPRRLRERFHPDLSHQDVSAMNAAALVFEARRKLTGLEDWPAMIARNAWFQAGALRRLSAIEEQPGGGRTRLFAFSYAARRLFAFAKARGWMTVLGQIDPGPAHERLVATLHRDHPSMAPGWSPAPSSYWSEWREECRLADRIVVNSEWSRDALIEEGVEAERLRVIPLAHDTGASPGGERRMPATFSAERPLRVLFLGQVSLPKGIAELLEAAEQLRGSPVVFTIVGPLQVRVPDAVRANPALHWAGSVPRSIVEQHYREADVFVLPTHSDGFGLTQLEAQWHGVPVIASRFCGNVVIDGVNGVRLPAVTGAAIASAISALLADPARLQAMRAQSRVDDRFGLEQVGRALMRASHD